MFAPPYLLSMLGGGNTEREFWVDIIEQCLSLKYSPHTQPVSWTHSSWMGKIGGHWFEVLYSLNTGSSL